MTRLAQSMVEGLTQWFDDGKPAEAKEAQPAPKAKARPERLVESFRRGLRGEGRYTKDLPRPRPADQLEEWIEQLRRLGAGV